MRNDAAFRQAAAPENQRDADAGIVGRLLGPWQIEAVITAEVKERILKQPKRADARSQPADGRIGGGNRLRQADKLQG